MHRDTGHRETTMCNIWQHAAAMRARNPNYSATWNLENNCGYATDNYQTE
jgi:hypothetical protein